IIAVYKKTFVSRVLENRHGVVPSFKEHFDGFGPKLRGIKTVEKDGPAATLSVSYFADKDGFPCGFTPAILLEIPITDHLNEPGPYGFPRPAQNDISRGISGFSFGAQFPALLIHDAFATYDHYILLQVVQVSDAIREHLQVRRMFRDQDNVRPAV